MSEFLTELRVERVDRDLWRLLSPLAYKSDFLRQVVIAPKDFLTDFESIPRWFPFAYAVAKGWATNPAVIHDYLYATPGFEKDDADDVFSEAMKATGVPWYLRGPMWWAVHQFGTPNYLKLQLRGFTRLMRQRGVLP